MDNRDQIYQKIEKLLQQYSAVGNRQTLTILRQLVTKVEKATYPGWHSPRMIAIFECNQMSISLVEK